MTKQAPAILTFDVEDHLKEYRSDSRYRDNTLRLLAALSEEGIRGTFFFVGRIAESAPDLVRAVARSGHEIACHSWSHLPLTRENPASFLLETRRAKHLLEDLSGTRVIGYRAPIFSLVASTTWALDSLLELGFAYSSSVMPAPNPSYGFPSAPRQPFRWPSGLVELPCPVAEIAGIRFPYLGGVYMRYLPESVIRMLMSSDPCACPWTYLHPYDIDDTEPFVHIPGSTLTTSLIVWLRRKDALRKILSLAGSARTLGEWVEQNNSTLMRYEPR